MLKIDARKLLCYSTDQLWDSLEGEFILSFIDGEVSSNEKECIFSSYIWDFHRRYPKTDLLVSHHVKYITGGGLLSSKTHLSLIGNVLWHVYDTYKHDVIDRVKLLDELARLAYEVTNNIYNDLTYKLEEYVTSIDIVDFINVMDQPEVNKAMCTIEPTQESMQKTYSTISGVLYNDVVLSNNPLIKAVRSGIVDRNQTMQCIGPRGFVTDIDSWQFKNPIKRGYAQGVKSLHDSEIESRSAAKSLAFSSDTLQKSEYFSRRQQLICQNVRHLHMTDCGSTNYLMWKVRDATYIGNTKTSDSDLKTIAGKYYLDDETNTLKIIKSTDTHLIGKTIKMRSVVAGCMHPDPYGVCEVCFGELALSVPANTNLGHATCVTMTEIITQMVLSVKHLDGNAVVEGIILKPYEKKYLTAPINGNVYYLNSDLKDKDVSLIIDPSCALGLTDIGLVDDVEKLNISRVSEFKFITLCIRDVKANCTDTIPIDVSVSKRFANMTHCLLRHIKTHGWGVTEDGKYIVNMKDWSYDKPILSLPMRHFDMGQHRSEIADMLEATVVDLTYRDSVVSPTALLIEFHDLVNKRLSVNLSILEMVIYSSMVVSAADNDYSLPKPWTKNGMGVMRLLLKNRSLSPAMAYEKHKESITAPSNYVNSNRMNHPFDSIIFGNETLAGLS